MSSDAKLLLGILVAVAVLALAGVAIEHAVFEPDAVPTTVAAVPANRLPPAGRRPKERNPAPERELITDDVAEQDEVSSDIETFAGQRRTDKNSKGKLKPLKPEAQRNTSSGTRTENPPASGTNDEVGGSETATSTPPSERTNETVTATQQPLPTSATQNVGVPAVPKDESTKLIQSLAASLWLERSQEQVSKYFNAANRDDADIAFAAWLMLTALTTQEKTGLQTVKGIRIDHEVARHLSIVAGHMPAGPVMYRVYTPLARVMEERHGKSSFLVPSTVSHEASQLIGNFEAGASEVMAARVLISHIAVTGVAPPALLSLLGAPGIEATAESANFPRPTDDLVYLLIETIAADPGFGNREYLKYSQRIDTLSPNRKSAYIQILEAVSGQNSKPTKSTKNPPATTTSKWAPHVALVAAELLTFVEVRWDASVPEQFWERGATAPEAPLVFKGSPQNFFNDFRDYVSGLQPNSELDAARISAYSMLRHDAHEGNVSLADLIPAIDAAAAALAKEDASSADGAYFLAALAPRFRRGLYQREWNIEEPTTAKETWSNAESRARTLSADEAKDFKTACKNFGRGKVTKRLDPVILNDVLCMLMLSSGNQKTLPNSIDEAFMNVSRFKESPVSPELVSAISADLHDTLLVSYIKLAPQATSERAQIDEPFRLLHDSHIEVNLASPTLDSSKLALHLKWSGTMGYLMSGNPALGKGDFARKIWATLLATQSTVAKPSSSGAFNTSVGTNFLVRERLLYAGLTTPSFDPLPKKGNE